MSRGWLEDVLQATGIRAGARFPRDLMSDVVMQLPVSVEVLPHLTAHGVRRWLGRQGVLHRVSDVDRALHGCLVGRAGKGIVFLDATDDEAERRFTLAHEVAHFILDHLFPRLRALKVFGKQILPVLDGERPATTEEMLSAVFERVRLGIQVHLMSRGPDGAVCAWDVEESEQRADRLALELLAPAEMAAAGLYLALDDAIDLKGQREHAAKQLVERFGIPAHVAGSYVRLLLGGRRRQLPLSKEIFGRK